MEVFGGWQLRTEQPRAIRRAKRLLLSGSCLQMSPSVRCARVRELLRRFVRPALPHGERPPTGMTRAIVSPRTARQCKPHALNADQAAADRVPAGRFLKPASPAHFNQDDLRSRSTRRACQSRISRKRLNQSFQVSDSSQATTELSALLRFSLKRVQRKVRPYKTQ
jgi:hypothetical protein